MGNDTMDIDQLAIYLQRDAREVRKMASRGYLPGQKVSGEWRFHPAEINHWIETQMHAYTEQELSALEAGVSRTRGVSPQLVIAPMLSEETIALPLRASTRTSVLKALVQLAEQSWQVYDPEAILEAIRQREDMSSTALPSGIALPHPHRPLPNALGDNVIAFGRTATGIPFGGGDGTTTDLFFLVLCRDYGTHLKTLARLSRLLLREDFLDELRAVETPAEALALIDRSETELV